MSSSDNLSTYFDKTLIGYNSAIKNGYPRSGYLRLVIWMCFLIINISFMLIGLSRNGDLVLVCGLYGVYEIVWEFMGVEPSATRRKLILISFILKKFYKEGDYSHPNDRRKNT